MTTTTTAAPTKRAAFGWAMYDFANSIWPMNVTTLYFALWVTVDHGAKDIVYGMALSASMLCVAVLSPVLGAVSDRMQRRIPFLVTFTLIAVAATTLIGRVGGLQGGVLLFVVANLAFQSGLIYYDALLGSVSTQANRGRISGMGVALGYAGTIAGIFMVKPFVDWGGRQQAFLPTAVLFLLFSLPCFMLVKEVAPKLAWRWAYVRDGYRQVGATLRQVRQYRDLFRFIVARFLYVDAISTVTSFMAVYTVKVLGFTDSMNQVLFVVGAAFAVLGAFLAGRVVDRIGPKKTLTIVLLLWVVVLVGAASTFYRPAFWAIGALVGFSLASLWTTDRVFLLRLAPPDRLGEFFGLFGVIGKLSAVLGPLLWGGTLLALEGLGQASYRVAILVLLSLLLAGLWVLRGVKEPAASTSNGGYLRG
ncbi:MAG: MFS transporter [Chloroflexi bacterium]|nr:MFS transporter [Chloroflexota bacterium]